MKLPNITKIYALQNWNIYLELLVRRIWNINQSYCISPFLLASLYLCFSVAHENIKPDSSLAAAAHAIYRHSLLGWNLLFRSKKVFFFFFFFLCAFVPQLYMYPTRNWYDLCFRGHVVQRRTTYTETVGQSKFIAQSCCSDPAPQQDLSTCMWSITFCVPSFVGYVHRLYGHHRSEELATQNKKRNVIEGKSVTFNNVVLILWYFVLVSKCQHYFRGL